MIEQYIPRNRYKFPRGKQRKFIKTCFKQLNYRNKDAAKKLSVSIRSITDWKKEKFLISVDAAQKLSKLSGIKIPSDKKELNKFWYVAKGGVIGGKAVLKKYGHIGGDPTIRKDKWFEWWKKEGRFQDRKIFHRKSIIRPRKSGYLAEFVGIMLGDGGISKNQVVVTLNSETEADYAHYVKNLIERLFGVMPSLIKDRNFLAIDLIVSRMELVDFCRNIGLKTGNKIKQGVDIPDWVKTNQNFMKLCVRGLIDTDGSFFTHKYLSNGKLYGYKKIDFCSYSKPLLNSVFLFLKSLGLRPRIVKDGKKLRIESVDTVKKYMEIIRTSNSKHLNRYRK